MQTKRISRSVLGVLAFGIFGIIGWTIWLASRTPASSHSDTRAPSVQLGGISGGTWKYDLELTTEAVLGGSRVLGLRLRGSFAISPFVAQGNRRLRVRLEQPHLEPTHEVSAEVGATIREVQSQLSDPCEYETGNHGSVSQVWFPTGIDPMASRLLRMVLVATQVVTPEGSISHNAWEIDESDLSGVFRIAYEWQPGTRTLSKSKRSLVRAHPGVGLGIRAVDIRVGKSHGQFHLDELGNITDFDYSEELAMVLDSGGAQPIEATSVTKVSLTNGTLVSDKPIELVTRNTLQAPQSPYVESAPEVHTAATDAQRIGGRKLPDIIGALQIIDRETPQGKQDAARLYVAASALFRRSPEAIAQAKAIIEKNGRHAGFLIAALGDAGSEAAASALADSLKTMQSKTTQRELLAALGRSSHPTPAVLEAIQSLYETAGVGGLARLMSGAMAYNARESAPQLATNAVNGLIQSLKTETRPAYIADDLRALGNSGDSKAAEVAARYATSDDPLLRGAAAEAVRRTNTPQGADVIVQLITDRNTSVRTSALTAALFSEPSAPLIAAVEQAARLDSQDSVRRDAVRVLVNWQRKEPTVRATIAWVSSNDANDKIRAVASEGLQRFN